MPKNEPDPEDPLELEAVCLPDPDGNAVDLMAQCFAEEFLRLGRTPEQVLAMFRSAEYSLPHRAWRQLGDARVRAIVDRQADSWLIPAGRRHRC